MTTKRFTYSMRGADEEIGGPSLSIVPRPPIKLPHPQTHMRELGFNHVRSECFSIFDVWLFECTSWPDTLPPYIRESPNAQFTDEITA